MSREQCIQKWLLLSHFDALPTDIHTLIIHIMLRSDYYLQHVVLPKLVDNSGYQANNWYDIERYKTYIIAQEMKAYLTTNYRIIVYLEFNDNMTILKNMFNVNCVIFRGDTLVDSRDIVTKFNTKEEQILICFFNYAATHGNITSNLSTQKVVTFIPFSGDYHCVATLQLLEHKQKSTCVQHIIFCRGGDEESAYHKYCSRYSSSFI